MKLIAHKQTKQEIENYLNNPVHAVEILGTKGAGKGYVAQYICCELIKVKNTQALQAYPYYYYLNAESDKTGIEQIRELQSKLTLKVPGSEPIRRILLIENFDAFGHEAQNALLKTLEEPPEDTVVMITISRHDKVLATIHSRTQIIQIRSISAKEARISIESYDEDALDKAYRISNGDVGLLYSLLEENIDHELARAIELAKNILSMPRYKRIAAIDKLTKSKDMTAEVLLDAIYRILNASKAILIESADKSNKLKNTVQRLVFVQEALRDLDKGVNAKLTLTRLFFRI